MCIISNTLVYSNWSFSLETLNSGKNWRFFCPAWHWKLTDDLQKQQGTSSILRQALSITSNPSVNSNLSCSPETLNSGQNWGIFVPRDLEIWWMTLKNNRAPFLYYIKLCAAFQSHWYIQTGVTVQTRAIRVKIGNFFVLHDLKNWWMTLKIIGHLAHIASSFVYYFIAICEFKQELQSGNA